MAHATYVVVRSSHDPFARCFGDGVWSVEVARGAAQWPQLKDESRLEIRQAEKQHAHACDRAWLISSHHYFCYFNTTYLISDHPHNGATMILICTTVAFYF